MMMMMLIVIIDFTLHSMRYLCDVSYMQHSSQVNCSSPQCGADDG